RCHGCGVSALRRVDSSHLQSHCTPPFCTPLFTPSAVRSPATLPSLRFPTISTLSPPSPSSSPPSPAR
ncbi:hypothetical protein STEG23_021806, partial [Scotinomys teguina]